MLKPLLAPLLKARAERQLPQAIVNHDYQKISDCLERGARNIDYMMMRDGDRPGERVPAGKFNNPASLAESVGLSRRGLELLAQYGLATPEQVARARVEGPRR